MAEDEKPEILPLPQWTENERALWLDLMGNYSQALFPADDSMLGGERREQACIEAVKLGAKLADLAIQEYSFREFVQVEKARKPGTRRAYEDFLAHIDRTRPIRKSRNRQLRRAQ